MTKGNSPGCILRKAPFEDTIYMIPPSATFSTASSNLLYGFSLVPSPDI